MAGTYRYRVAPHDIDSTLRVRIYSMGDIILQAAGDDADNLGFGVKDLNVSNSSWVLSRMAVEMRRIPSRHEPLDIYTWVSDYGRLVTTRNMTVADGEGQEIGAAVTQWAMIDLATRRAMDLSVLSNKGASLVDREPPIERPRRIGAFGRNADCDSGYAENLTERTHVVVYSDTDFNGHVNSMKYLEWMADTMPAGELAGAAGFRFDINYIHEAKLGEPLVVCCGVIDGLHSFDIRNSEGISICRAAIQIS